MANIPFMTAMPFDEEKPSPYDMTPSLSPQMKMMIGLLRQKNAAPQWPEVKPPSAPDPSSSLPWWAQGANVSQPQPGAWPSTPQTPLPAPRPAAANSPVPMPMPRPAEAPSADPMGWFQRNAYLQTDPETGAYLDPELARRALGI